MRDRAGVARWAHNPKVVGSNPSPATKGSIFDSYPPRRTLVQIYLPLLNTNAPVCVNLKSDTAMCRFFLFYEKPYLLKMFVVYILYSEKFKKHYVGFTSDLEQRILSHNELACKGFTIKYRPWKVIHTEEFELKTDAMAKEKFLKTGKGRDFIKTLKH